MTKWLKETPYANFEVHAQKGDASARSYFRLVQGKKSAILMDSSRELGSLEAFVRVHTKLDLAGGSVPKIYERNLERGYLILEDLGSTHYLDLLDTSNFVDLYKKAIDEIAKMQRADARDLPLYDREFLHFEMDLMQEWYLQKHLKLELSSEEKSLLQNSLSAISAKVLEQPQGFFVHRDYHSRNIMLRGDGSLGIIDFQDAMSGAITYDLVSLLKDCYIEFERAHIEELALYFRDLVSPKVSDEEFLEWFDFMGLQRHIKVLGVFSRLSIRDGKDGYLGDIPLTLKYVTDTASRYSETSGLARLLQKYIDRD